LDTQIKELKSDFSREKEHYESKIRSAEVEKAELSAVEQSLRENLERLQSEKQQVEPELEGRLQHEKSEMQREIGEYKSKLVNTESHASDLQRKVMSVESENEKDKALLE
jgi:chromosome segregation ATPase